MGLKNVIRAYEWEVDSLLKLVVVLLTIYFFLLFLDEAGRPLELLQVMVSLIIILFIPGTLFLRLLKWEYRESSMEVLLYTLGISVAIILFLGFMLDLVLGFMGVIRTLTPGSFNTALVILILIMSYLIYRQGPRKNNRIKVELPSPDLGFNFKALQGINSMDIRNMISPPLLLILLVPFLGILSAHLMNLYDLNLLAMVLIILIGVVTLLIGFKKFPERIFPLAIFLIALSLLYHKSLITTYIWGWDVSFEYYMAQEVVRNGYWVMQTPNNYNSMLSVVILGPALSFFTGLNMVWVFKVVYPFLFALMPVSMYFIFKKQLNSTMACLSVFLFIFMFTFYTEMLALLRQTIAELFLVLLILLMVSSDLKRSRRSFLAVIFSLGIVVSHYGLSYIWMFALIFCGVLLLLNTPLDKINTFIIHLLPLKLTLEEKISIPDSSYQQEYLEEDLNPVGVINFKRISLKGLWNNDSSPRTIKLIQKYREDRADKFFSWPLVLLFIIFLITWYLYTASSSPLISIINAINDIFSNILSFMDPDASQGLSLVLVQQKSFLRDIHKYLYLVSQFLVALGIMALLLKQNVGMFKKEYKIFSLAAFFLLVAGVAVPFLSSQFNTSRLLHMALIFLSPFFMVGIFWGFSLLKSFFKRIPLKRGVLRFSAVFLLVILVMDSGLVYQFFPTEEGISIAMDPDYDFPKFNQQEVRSSDWVKNNFGLEGIYADKHRASVLRSFLPDCEEIPVYKDLIQSDYYVFMGTMNILKNGVYLYQMTGANVISELGYVNPEDILKKRPKIYDNGGSWIYGGKVE